MLNHVASLIFNTPLLVSPDYAETILAAVGDRFDVDNAEMVATTTPHPAPYNGSRKEMAVIPIVGSISHRPTGMQAASGITSYTSIRADIEAALDDPNVDRILLDISSPGGMVSGAFDLRDFIMSQRGRKPIAAIARDTMASAAYLIGSAADHVYATQTAMVGSIGVIMTHIDRSKQLSNEGVKPTFITAGAMKAAGNSAEPLADDVRAEIQAEVDHTYEMFVSAVAEARGLSPEAIKETEARVFNAATALEVGLVDEIASLDLAIQGFAASEPRTYPSMSIQEESQMDEDKLRAEGATAERARVSAILGSDAAKGRAKLAHHLAFSTEMTADAANAVLAASAEESPAAPEASSEVADLRAEIDALKAAPQSASAGLSELSSDAAGVSADSSAETGGEGQSMTAEQKRYDEARKNARAFFGSK